MCTAIRFNDRLFGRTLDFESSFGEQLVITPRGRIRIGEAENRYAIMGVGIKNGDTSLYFDGVNEWGLAAAALNFPRFAVYRDDIGTKAGVSSAGLISMMLGLCRSVDEVRTMLENITVTNASATEEYKTTPLHWTVADQRESLVIESVADGLKLYDNPVGVLTNSPELPYHLTRLEDFGSLSVRNPRSEPPLYSRGMGAVGLPGDFSSTSRFVRAAFLKENALFSDKDEVAEDIHLALDILASVSIPRGAVISDEGLPVTTRYTAVIDMDRPGYYLTTATCRTVSRCRLSDSLAEAGSIITIPIYKKPIIEEL